MSTVTLALKLDLALLLIDSLFIETLACFSARCFPFASDLRLVAIDFTLISLLAVDFWSESAAIWRKGLLKSLVSHSTCHGILVKQVILRRFRWSIRRILLFAG